MAHSKKRKYNLGICQHNPCSTERTRIYFCKYCGKSFCSNHLKAKMPYPFNSSPRNALERLAIKEWRNTFAHPCPLYSDYMHKKEEERKKKLEAFLKSRTKSIRIRKTKEPYVRRARPRKTYASYIFITILIVILIWYFFFFNGENSVLSTDLNCTDGTLYNTCSKNQPSYCSNGTLMKNASMCGCPSGYMAAGNDCKAIQRCTDTTIYGVCSNNKPLYCENGRLINKSSKCGCPPNEIVDNETCVSEYKTEPKQITLCYGGLDCIKFTVYAGLNDYLKGIDRSISYYDIPPTDKDFIMRDLNNREQKKLLEPLVDEIKKINPNREDQAKIAIRLVQNIPYDYNGANTNTIYGKYPYEVLYTQKGVCSEKSELLVYLLRGLGYGVAILRFEVENHDAVGINCSPNFQYKNTGYCFVESTSVSAVGDSYGYYVGAGQLTSDPEVIVIAEGESFNQYFS